MLNLSFCKGYSNCGTNDNANVISFVLYLEQISIKNTQKLRSLTEGMLALSKCVDISVLVERCMYIETIKTNKSFFNFIKNMNKNDLVKDFNKLTTYKKVFPINIQFLLD